MILKNVTNTELMLNILRILMSFPHGSPPVFAAWHDDQTRHVHNVALERESLLKVLSCSIYRTSDNVTTNNTFWKVISPFQGR